MTKAKRISLSLFDEDLKDLINASAKIFPMTQEDIDNNLNPNGYEYARVNRKIYVWEAGKWDYVIADDIEVLWKDILDKPLKFSPVEHQHSEADINDLDKYTKQETDALLADKAEADHTHDYSASNHNHDEDYAVKAIEADVTDMLQRLFNIENGYTEGHTHPNVDVINSITQAMLDAWNTVTSKADKSYVDDELLKKANATALSGHTSSTTIHVTQADKDNWNAKADLDDIPSSISIGTVKPTDGSVWYEIIE